MKFRKKGGFTLVELLVVLSIIALLVSLVGPAVFKHLAPAKRSVAKAQIEIFSSALDSYYVDTGKFPSSAEGLEALRTAPSGLPKWNGPYLKKELPLDPWGNKYVYRSPGRNGGYEIVSFGEDGVEGGKDDNADINSWESNK
jgi:general secretion pathway protein G